jgi:glutathione S-transferase
MPAYILHTSLRSPFGRRVRLLLEELKADYETVIHDVFAPTPELIALNPLGRVPVLQLADGRRLIDSWEIVEYLKERHGADPLFARGGADEIRLRNVTALALGVMEGAVAAFLERAMRAPAMRSLVVEQDALESIERALRALETEVRGPYVAGEKLGVWDLELGAALAYCDLRQGPALVDARPVLREYLKRLNARESFKKTVPPA